MYYMYYTIIHVIHYDYMYYGVIHVIIMYHRDGGGGWLLTSFFSIIYILGLVCYKHTIHVIWCNTCNMV